MELRQLRYFIQAAERLNFTEAAGDLYISQSTLSQQIKQLEDELGIPLFDRIGKRIRLTEAGGVFLPHARQTVQEAEQGRHSLQDLMDLRTGQLTIGTTYGIASLLIGAMTQFTAQYPSVRLRIQFGTTEELLSLLHEAKLDFVLSFIPVQQNEAYVSTPLFDSVLSLVVHQKHPMAKASRITLPQLVGLPLALPVNTYSIRTFLDQVLSRKKVSLQTVIEVNDINLLLQLANTGQWGTVLMNTSLFDYPSLRAVPLVGKEMKRQATITWSAGAYRKKSATIFAEFLVKGVPQG